MDVPFLLTGAQMRRIGAYFPLSHGIPGVDDRRIVSGIIHVIKHGLMWRDAPKGYGPHKTVYNRFIRWSRLGVFNRIFAELAAKGGKPDMTDARTPPCPLIPVATTVNFCLPRCVLILSETGLTCVGFRSCAGQHHD